MLWALAVAVMKAAADHNARSKLQLHVERRKPRWLLDEQNDGPGASWLIKRHLLQSVFVLEEFGHVFPSACLRKGRPRPRVYDLIRTPIPRPPQLPCSSASAQCNQLVPELVHWCSAGQTSRGDRLYHMRCYWRYASGPSNSFDIHRALSIFVPGD